MTEKDAVLQALGLWVWLYNNPGEGKKGYPDYSNIQHYLSGCPLCEFHKEVVFLEDDGVDTIPHCEKCFGRKKSKKYMFLFASEACFSGAYYQWGCTREKRYSGYIASKIRRYAYKKGYLVKLQKEGVI